MLWDFGLSGLCIRALGFKALAFGVYPLRICALLRALGCEVWV